MVDNHFTRQYNPEDSSEQIKFSLRECHFLLNTIFQVNETDFVHLFSSVYDSQCSDAVHVTTCIIEPMV
jgi:hypothetical protein